MAKLRSSMRPNKIDSTSFTNCLSEKVIKFLNLVDVNHRDKICDQTPLFYAAKEGHLEMCKVLVENGANIAHSDSQHKMASHYARRASKN